MLQCSGGFFFFPGRPAVRRVEQSKSQMNSRWSNDPLPIAAEAGERREVTESESGGVEQGGDGGATRQQQMGWGWDSEQHDGEQEMTGESGEWGKKKKGEEEEDKKREQKRAALSQESRFDG